MLSKISEMSGNRWQEAKQSHLAVCLSSKGREKRIYKSGFHATTQRSECWRYPETGDWCPIVHDPRRVKRQPSSLARRSSKFCSQKCLRLRESQRAPRNVHRFNGHFPFPNLILSCHLPWPMRVENPIAMLVSNRIDHWSTSIVTKGMGWLKSAIAPCLHHPAEQNLYDKYFGTTQERGYWPHAQHQRRRPSDIRRKPYC